MLEKSAGLHLFPDTVVIDEVFHPIVRLAATIQRPISLHKVTVLGHMPECRSELFCFLTDCQLACYVDFTPATRPGAHRSEES
jgi:hypothetical protein